MTTTEADEPVDGRDVDPYNSAPASQVAVKHPMPCYPVPALARRIFDLMAASRIEARIVGGAVRDWLASGSPPDFDNVDIDMAVAAPIGDVAGLLRGAGLRVIETGLSHGTVTIVDGPDAVEMTQTRVDVETDGRHAVVEFSDDWTQDARRRDFTINALYIDADGKLHDPLAGMADLQAGVLRFVGDARQRVAEDALRMLRYCRFLPRFGRGIDDDSGADARHALRAMADSAANLSGERVAAECRKLLSSKGAIFGMSVMEQTGVARAALGVELEVGRLQFLPSVDVLYRIYGDLVWIAGLAVITPAECHALLTRRLRLSRRESQFLAQLAARDSQSDHAELSGSKWRQTAWFMVQDGQVPVGLYVVATARLGQKPDKALLRQLTEWVPPVFPVTPTDLLSHGVDKGPAVGESLRRLQHVWAKNDFTPSRNDLLATLSDQDHDRD